MTPRLRIWGACRALAIRSRPVAPRTRPFINSISRAPRWYSTEGDGQPPKPIDGSNNLGKPQSQVTSEDVNNGETPVENEGSEAAIEGSGTAGKDSEAAVKSSKSGTEGSEVAVKGSETTPSDSPSHMEALPDDMLEQLFYGGRTVTSASDSALTPAQEESLYRDGVIPSPDVAEALNAAAEGAEEAEQTEELAVEKAEEQLLEEEEEVEAQRPTHKFGIPRGPWPEDFHHKKRYHPVLQQITRLLMRDGKLAAAQRNVAEVMNFLRTAPAPIYSPKFPLLPGTPPAAYLPLNPILYITIAIDSVAPLIKVRNVSGASGGGRSLEIPMPLAVRQRRRVAFQWILDVINKKPSKGSGRKQFPVRIAEEIIAVVEGRSGVWEKRKQVHKLGTAARANVSAGKIKTKKKM